MGWQCEQKDEFQLGLCSDQAQSGLWVIITLRTETNHFWGPNPIPTIVHLLRWIMSKPAYSLFCMGNPLLDLQVWNGEKLLEKYGLKANDAILAGEKQAGMYRSFSFPCSFLMLMSCIVWSYDELVKEHQVTYVAGGAAQNAARGAAVSWKSNFWFRCLALSNFSFFFFFCLVCSSP